MADRLIFTLAPKRPANGCRSRSFSDEKLINRKTLRNYLHSSAQARINTSTRWDSEGTYLGTRACEKKKERTTPAPSPTGREYHTHHNLQVTKCGIPYANNACSLGRGCGHSVGRDDTRIRELLCVQASSGETETEFHTSNADECHSWYSRSLLHSPDVTES